MTRYNSEALAYFPWIASCDTLRLEDLLPKFWSVAEVLALAANKPEALSPATLASLAKLVGEDSREADWDDAEASQTLEELTDALQELAPTGFYFGSQDGDGACFGFWLDETWAEALEHFGMGNDDPTGWAELIAELDADGIEPDTAEDSYCGRAEGWSEERAGADYAQQLAEDLGVKLDQMEWPLTCVDWEAAWRELEMGDGYSLHSIGGGDWLVFRAV
jgi:hypothetical protein